MLTLGMGFHAEVDGLHLEVEVGPQGWQYRIIANKDNGVVADCTPSRASTGQYLEPENAKFQAVCAALGFLGRTQEDPHSVFRELHWQQYGHGHA